MTVLQLQLCWPVILMHVSPNDPGALLRHDRTKLYEGKLAALSAIKDALQKENEQLREAASTRSGVGGGDGGYSDDKEAREMLGTSALAG